MKKLKGFIGLSLAATLPLTAGLMGTNHVNLNNKQNLNGSVGYTPPTPPPNTVYTLKYTFHIHQQNDPRTRDGSYAQYYRVMTEEGMGNGDGRYQLFLTPAGAADMWGETTSNWPDSGHPKENLMYWMNANAPGWYNGINETGDYINNIKNGIIVGGGYHVIGSDSNIINDFESQSWGSMWSKIEAYINSKTTADLELSFQYNYRHFGLDGFYFNASWPH